MIWTVIALALWAVGGLATYIFGYRVGQIRGFRDGFHAGRAANTVEDWYHGEGMK
jgi:hypothetical protein